MKNKLKIISNSVLSLFSFHPYTIYKRWFEIGAGILAWLGVLALITVFLTSCNGIGKHNTPKFELLQMGTQTQTSKEDYACFFLVSEELHSESLVNSNTKVRVFANVEGKLMFIEMPINRIIINIDNSLGKPNIQIMYKYFYKVKNEKVITYNYDKTYIINCPEKYLPELLKQ